MVDYFSSIYQISYLWDMSYLRIKELLKDRNLTAKELARDLGIAENSLSRIITEKQQPRFDLLRKIADRLNVEVWQLFKGSDKAVSGFVEYQGSLHRIRTRQDLEELLSKMD